MRWAVVVLALAALAWPGTALAKEVKSAAVCGADGCEDAGRGQQFITLFQDPPSMPGGTNGANVHTVLDPVRVQPYYRVVVTMGGRGERTFHAVFFFIAPNLFRAYDQTGVLSIPFRRIDAAFARTRRGPGFERFEEVLRSEGQSVLADVLRLGRYARGE